MRTWNFQLVILPGNYWKDVYAVAKILKLSACYRNQVSIIVHMKRLKLHSNSCLHTFNFSTKFFSNPKVTTADISNYLLRDPEECAHVGGSSEKPLPQDNTKHYPQATFGGHVVVQNLTQYQPHVSKLKICIMYNIWQTVECLKFVGLKLFKLLGNTEENKRNSYNKSTSLWFQSHLEQWENPKLSEMEKWSDWSREENSKLIYALVPSVLSVNAQKVAGLLEICHFIL